MAFDRFRWLNALLDAHLDPTVQALGAQIFRRFDGAGEAYPSREELADRLGLSVRSVRRHLKALFASGFLKRKGRRFVASFPGKPDNRGQKPDTDGHFETSKPDTGGQKPDTHDRFDLPQTGQPWPRSGQPWPEAGHQCPVSTTIGTDHQNRPIEQQQQAREQEQLPNSTEAPGREEAKAEPARDPRQFPPLDMPLEPSGPPERPPTSDWPVNHGRPPVPRSARGEATRLRQALAPINRARSADNTCLLYLLTYWTASELDEVVARALRGASHPWRYFCAGLEGKAKDSPHPAAESCPPPRRSTPGCVPKSLSEDDKAAIKTSVADFLAEAAELKITLEAERKEAMYARRHAR